MLKLYSNYISAHFIVPFLVSTIFFVSFLMTFELFRIMTLMTSDDLSFLFILELVGNVMTTLIPMAVPLSVFFSVIFSLNRLSGDSEYVALRAAGLDKFKILRPYLIVSLLVAISLYFFNQEIVPSAHTKVRRKIKILSSTSLVQGLKSGQFFTHLSNITIFPSEVDDVTKEIKDIYLHLFDDEQKLEKVIVAKYGKIIHEKNEKTGVEKLTLELKNGNITNMSDKTNETEKILFEKYLLPISEQRFSYQTSMKEIMMSKDELNSFIAGGLEAAKKNGFDKKDYFNATYEYWNRLNTPLLCLILTFLGFTLGVTGNRGKAKGSSGKAILYLIGYYVVYFSIVSAAREGQVPVFLCAVIPNLLLIGLGLKTFRKMDWLS